MRDSFVIESNIIFDLDHGNLLSPFFQLPIDVCACDLIHLESLTVPVTRLETLGLVLLPVSGEIFREIGIVRERYPGLSVIDIS